MRKSVAALGRPYGPNSLPRIDGLFGCVEKEASARPLRLHDAHGVLRDRLMGEQVELERLAEHAVAHLADAALPSSAGVRHHDVDSAERAGDHVERKPEQMSRLRTFGTTANAKGPTCRATKSRRVEVAGRARRFVALGFMALAVAAPIPRAAAGNERHLSAPEVFQAALPSFACSSDQYSTSNWSASEIDWYRAIDSAAATTSTVFSAMSAAIAASLGNQAPSPNMPTPGTRITRGSGSSGFRGLSARLLFRSKYAL